MKFRRNKWILTINGFPNSFKSSFEKKKIDRSLNYKFILFIFSKTDPTLKVIFRNIKYIRYHVLTKAKIERLGEFPNAVSLHPSTIKLSESVYRVMSWQVLRTTTVPKWRPLSEFAKFSSGAPWRILTYPCHRLSNKSFIVVEPNLARGKGVASCTSRNIIQWKYRPNTFTR